MGTRLSLHCSNHRRRSPGSPYDSTTPVTVNEMLHHCQAVTRIQPRAFVVGDMPLGSYQVSKEEAVRNAIRFVKEGGVDAVKIEGGKVREETIRAIAEAGIAVMGHIGFTPQSAVSFGSQIVAGRDAQSAIEIYRDALAVSYTHLTLPTILLV